MFCLSFSATIPRKSGWPSCEAAVSERCRLRSAYQDAYETVGDGGGCGDGAKRSRA
ncbi:MAG: hypothetical protein LBD24_05645 [Spirochaetaceae bacterium]|nr:hypothetical protein [Spirochaetaceae bacterium]